MLFLTFSFFFSIYAKISLWNFDSRRLYSLLYFLDVRVLVCDGNAERV